MSWCPQEARSLRAACLLVHWETEREDGDPPPPPREPVRLRVAWGGGVRERRAAPLSSAQCSSP